MAAPEWAPTPDQVAAILHARTRGTGTGATSSREQGRWLPAGRTPTTRPTLEQVEAIIELACGEISAAFEGRQPCSPATNDAARTAALYAACETVEISYYPESGGEGSAVEALGEKKTTAMAAAARAVIAHCPLNPDDPDDDGGALAPAGRGRDPRYPVMGFDTRW